MQRLDGAAFKRLLVLLAIAGMLSGCAALKVYPERSNDLSKDLDALSRYFDPEVITKGEKTRAWRDEVVNAQIRAIDLQFTSFEQSLAMETAGLNTAVDLAVIGLGAATGVVGGAGIKAILGVVAGGLTGAKGVIDKDIFYSKTLPVLLTQMEAQRKVQLVKIREGLKLDAKTYPLGEALIDVEDYYKSGSIPAALQKIAEQSGAAGQEATERLQQLAVATEQDVADGQLVRRGFNTLFRAWKDDPESDAGKEALANAKSILSQFQPDHRLDGRAAFEALDSEIKKAADLKSNPEQLRKLTAAFSAL